MIAYVPGRRRNVRSVAWKWSLITVVVAAVMSVLAASVVALDKAQDQEVVVPLQADQTVSISHPYFPARGPDLSLPAAYATPLQIALPPVTRSVVQLHVGPQELYAVLGILQAGATIEVAGRSEDGEWLAIVFPPNSTLRAWLRTSQVLNLQNVDELPVEPVRLIQ